MISPDFADGGHRRRHGHADREPGRHRRPARRVHRRRRQASSPGSSTSSRCSGEWRISDPPDGLIILEPDFERLYDERDVVLPRPHRAARGARPAAADQGRARSRPRSSSGCWTGRPRPLAAGVRNPLAGVQLRSAVTITRPVGGRRPDRGPGRPGAGAVRDLRADRVDARASLEPDGRDPRRRRTGAHRRASAGADASSDWAAFDPDAVPAGRGGALPERRGAAHGDRGRAGAGAGRDRRLRRSPAPRSRPTRAPASSDVPGGRARPTRPGAVLYAGQLRRATSRRCSPPRR